MKSSIFAFAYHRWFIVNPIRLRAVLFLSLLVAMCSAGHAQTSGGTLTLTGAVSVNAAGTVTNGGAVTYAGGSTLTLTNWPQIGTVVPLGAVTLTPNSSEVIIPNSGLNSGVLTVTGSGLNGGVLIITGGGLNGGQPLTITGGSLNLGTVTLTGSSLNGGTLMIAGGSLTIHPYTSGFGSPLPAGVLPAFFNRATLLNTSGSVFYLGLSNGNPFGYFAFLGDLHYLYHFDLGYEYVIDAQDGHDGVFLYDFKSGTWFYTSPTFPFPYLYNFTLRSIVYYCPDPDHAGHYNTDGFRWFYDFATGQYITK